LKAIVRAFGMAESSTGWGFAGFFPAFRDRGSGVSRALIQFLIERQQSRL
jgi:hypothetical protein